MTAGSSPGGRVPGGRPVSAGRQPRDPERRRGARRRDPEARVDGPEPPSREGRGRRDVERVVGAGPAPESRPPRRGRHELQHRDLVLPAASDVVEGRPVDLEPVAADEGGPALHGDGHGPGRSPGPPGTGPRRGCRRARASRRGAHGCRSRSWRLRRSQSQPRTTKAGAAPVGRPSAVTAIFVRRSTRESVTHTASSVATEAVEEERAGDEDVGDDRAARAVHRPHARLEPHLARGPDVAGGPHEPGAGVPVEAAELAPGSTREQDGDGGREQVAGDDAPVGERADVERRPGSRGDALGADAVGQRDRLGAPGSGAGRRRAPERRGRPWRWPRRG